MVGSQQAGYFGRSSYKLEENELAELHPHSGLGKKPQVESRDVSTET